MNSHLYYRLVFEGIHIPIALRVSQSTIEFDTEAAQPKVVSVDCSMMIDKSCAASTINNGEQSCPKE